MEKKLWAPRGGGCIMDHLGAPLWPGVGSLWLLLTGAALAPPPNSPGPKFESKGKEGWSCGRTPTRSWRAMQGPELSASVLRTELVSEAPGRFCGG